MEWERRVQVLEGVLAAVINRALNEDRLPPAVVRLALADALHTVRELERQLEERRAAAEKTAAAESEKKKAARQAADGNAVKAADGEKKEAMNDGEQIEAG